MDFEEGLTRIKDVLASDGYLILGYPHTDEQQSHLEPWFYPRDKKKGLPPSTSEFLNILRDKYPLAAEYKFNKRGLPVCYYFFGIQADGLDVQEVGNRMTEYNQFLTNQRTKANMKIFTEIPRGGSQYFQFFVLMFTNGIADNMVDVMRSAHKYGKGLKLTRPFVIDFQGKRSYRHKGLPPTPSAPDPSTFDPRVFGNM